MAKTHSRPDDQHPWHRLRQDAKGRHFIDSGNYGFELQISSKLELGLSDLLPAFVRPSQETEPNVILAGDFVEPLQPAEYLLGNSPLCSLRLTTLKDRAVLGFFMCHALAGTI